jgi:hypothetical protein
MQSSPDNKLRAQMMKGRLVALSTVTALVLVGLTACSATSTETPSASRSASSQSAEDAEGEVSESATETETGTIEGSESKAKRGPTRVAMSFAEGITSEEVSDWVDAATGQMLNPPTDFMGLVWPIGKALDDEPDPQVFDGDPFMEHSHILGEDELDEVAAYFRNWQAGLEGCDPEDARGFDEGAARVERWIKGGANVATAPDPCFESRSAIVAWSADQDKQTAKQVFFHESYHGLSNYLLRQCSPVLGRQEDSMNDLRWFAEGTADYFGVFMAAKDDGRDDYVQTMLKRAYLDLRGDPEMPLEANTYVQAAAMVLMIERGMITEKQLLNGSYFNSCDWINTFDPDAPGMDYIFENFNKIEVSGGSYSYSEATIEG